MRIAIVSVFGLIPSLWLSYIFGRGIAWVPALFASDRFFDALYALLIGGLCLFGTYTLIRYLFGRAIESLRIGMISGAAATAVIVAAPFVKMYLANIGVIELRFNSGMDNYGILMGNAMLAMSPLVVYSVLSSISFRKRRTSLQLNAT